MCKIYTEFILNGDWGFRIGTITIKTFQNKINNDVKNEKAKKMILIKIEIKIKMKISKMMILVKKQIINL